jgi:hypothetical protein
VCLGLGGLDDITDIAAWVICLCIQMSGIEVPLPSDLLNAPRWTMSPSLSKTEAKPVEVPETSPALLISSWTIYVALNPFRGNGIGGLGNQHGPPLAGGVVGSFADLLARSR